MSEERIFSSKQREDEKEFDSALRPQRFEDFVGQKNAIENLGIYIQAANQRSEILDHILFSGMPGLGKTTLSYIIANEIGTGLKHTQGPILMKPGDLAGILSNLNIGDILFIDEIHRMNRAVEEYLYQAMEDFKIDIMIDQGPKARSIKMKIEPFTLIGATTREGLLSGPLRARFGVREKLEVYPWEDLVKIINRSAKILKIKIEEESAQIIAKRSRGVPRIANRFLRRIRDVAQVKGDNVITKKIAEMGLEMLGIDAEGLESLDRKILKTLIRHSGGPVGIKTIAVTVGEEEETIEEVYEPFLIRKGFMCKTPRGRVATKAACEHLNADLPKDEQGSLF